MERRYCKNCATVRKAEICHKCGQETFVPDERWEEPEIPDVEPIRKLAYEVGYAIGEHGSKERDLDLIAAPWTEDAIGNYGLAKHIADGLGGFISGWEHKPLGRVAFTIKQPGWYKCIDLSVCPILRSSESGKEETEEVANSRT